MLWNEEKQKKKEKAEKEKENKAAWKAKHASQD